MTSAGSLAKTPSPPYYAVIFTSLRTKGDRGYGRRGAWPIEWLRWPHRYLGFLVWSLFAIRRDWGLPSPIGNQRMRFEGGRSIRNTKLPKKPARECSTQTM